MPYIQLITFWADIIWVVFVSQVPFEPGFHLSVSFLCFSKTSWSSDSSNFWLPIFKQVFLFVLGLSFAMQVFVAHACRLFPSISLLWQILHYLSNWSVIIIPLCLNSKSLLILFLECHASYRVINFLIYIYGFWSSTSANQYGWYLLSTCSFIFICF